MTLPTYYNRKLENYSTVYVCAHCGLLSFDRWGDNSLSKNWSLRCTENANWCMLRNVQLIASLLSFDLVAGSVGTMKIPMPLGHLGTPGMKSNSNRWRY